MLPEEEAAGAIGLGGGCGLSGAEPVSWTFKGGVVVPREREGVRKSSAGPSAWVS